jgi:hypothetical protein
LLKTARDAPIHLIKRSQELKAGKYALFTYSLSPFIFFSQKKKKLGKLGEKKEKEKEKEKGGLPRERLTTSNAKKDQYEGRNMNENDLSDLVSKTKKSGGSKTKRTRAKSARKQPLQKNF